MRVKLCCRGERNFERCVDNDSEIHVVGLGIRKYMTCLMKYCGDLPESRIDPLIKNFSCVRKKEFLRSPAFDPLKDAFVWMGYGLLPYPLEFNKLQKSNINDLGIKQSRQLKHPPTLFEW